NPGELGLEAGKIYEIIDKNTNGWWLGLRNGIEGWIPSNYLSADPEPDAPARQAPAAPVLPRPPGLRNGGSGGGDLAASQQNGNSMAQLAAALASGSPTSAKAPNNGQANAPARPGINRFAQEDSDDEEAWE
ncbi:class II myosin, partial [Coemansia sp. RSA 2559]